MALILPQSTFPRGMGVQGQQGSPRKAGKVQPASLGPQFKIQRSNFIYLFIYYSLTKPRRSGVKGSLILQILCLGSEVQGNGSELGWNMSEGNGRMAPGTARLAIAFPCFLEEKGSIQSSPDVCCDSGNSLLADPVRCPCVLECTSNFTYFIYFIS